MWLEVFEQADYPNQVASSRLISISFLETFSNNSEICNINGGFDPLYTRGICYYTVKTPLVKKSVYKRPF